LTTGAKLKPIAALLSGTDWAAAGAIETGPTGSGRAEKIKVAAAIAPAAKIPRILSRISLYAPTPIWLVAAEGKAAPTGFASDTAVELIGTLADSRDFTWAMARSGGRGTTVRPAPMVCSQ
jgi:hypothetical protein